MLDRSEDVICELTRSESGRRRLASGFYADGLRPGDRLREVGILIVRFIELIVGEGLDEPCRLGSCGLGPSLGFGGGGWGEERVERGLLGLVADTDSRGGCDARGVSVHVRDGGQLRGEDQRGRWCILVEVKCRGRLMSGAVHSASDVDMESLWANGMIDN